MARRSSKARTKSDWGRLGLEAARAGDPQTALGLLERAVKAERRRAGHRFNLALVLEQLGAPGEAMVRLTEALRLDPGFAEAARRLSVLLAHYTLDEPGALDAFGLKAALAFDTVDRQPLAEGALAHAAQTTALGAALAQGRTDGWDMAARRLIAKKTDAALRNDLLLLGLGSGVNVDPDLERLLTALRRTMLLELEDERFRDRALTAFAAALIAQLMTNEYVFAVSPPEQEALDVLHVDREAALAGADDASRALLLACLYAPAEAVLGDVAPDDCAGLKPKPLRELVAARLTERAEERALAETLPRIGDIADTTSQKVAAQYEASPYPRWRSLHVPAPGSLARALTRFFAAERLAFMEGPFDVLIAGCGTGHHALLSALAYGPEARVLAIDLSAASLAYAKRMAARFGAENIEFAQADILSLAGLDRSFHIVESVGVLHHMAEPFAGWRVLAERLRPGGLMLVGLYSALSRQNLMALRDDPAYPGPGCSDVAARAFRAELMARAEGAPGAQLVRSHDFYALSAFRDLVLHESEAQMTLDEIADFLDKSALAFRGFTLGPHVLDAFAEAYPDDPFPGTLVNWAAFEQANSTTFDGMYQFWCEKAG